MCSHVRVQSHVVYMFLCGSCLVFMPLHSCPCTHALVFVPLHSCPCIQALAFRPLYSCPRIHALVFMPSCSCPCAHALMRMPSCSCPCLLIDSLSVSLLTVSCYPASIVLSLVFHGFVYVLSVWSFIKPLFLYIVHLGPTLPFHRLTSPNRLLSLDGRPALESWWFQTSSIYG